MEFVNFFSMSEYNKCLLSIELMNRTPIIRAMYNDICNTIGCFAPKLDIELIGRIEDMSEKYGTGRAGCYVSPGSITINLIDIYCVAYYDGTQLGIHDMDQLFMSKVAYVITHELSHSMQDLFVDPVLYNGMEWANDVNVWNVLFPLIAPMLKKKYKIKIFDENVDTTVGKLYDCKYETLNDLEIIISSILSMCNDGSGTYNDFVIDKRALLAANNLTLDISIMGTRQVSDLVVNGVVNFVEVAKIRQLMSYRFNYVTIDYDFNFTNNGKDARLFFSVTQPTSPVEMFFDPNDNKMNTLY